MVVKLLSNAIYTDCHRIITYSTTTTYKWETNGIHSICTECKWHVVHIESVATYDKHTRTNLVGISAPFNLWIVRLRIRFSVYEYVNAIHISLVINHQVVFHIVNQFDI